MKQDNVMRTFKGLGKENSIFQFMFTQLSKAPQESKQRRNENTFMQNYSKCSKLANNLAKGKPYKWLFSNEY